jgi:hypothetical protein
MSKIDPKLFDMMKEHADDIEQGYSRRNDDFDQYKEMYLMDWDKKPQHEDDIKVTISPDARNAIVGIKRLMTATEPQFSIPKDKGDKTKSDDEKAIEQAANSMWSQSGRIRMPVHYSAVESSTLFGEVHIAITSTMELVKMAKKLKRGVARAEKIAAMTPFLFECWNPRDGYFEEDILGLTAYLRKVDLRVSKLSARFGDAVEDIVRSHKQHDEVEVCFFYDLENYGVWIEDTPIMAEPHGLPFIPVVAKITEGTTLFEDKEYQRQPHLYTLLKSSMWERQNMMLTVLMTNIYQLGLNPLFRHSVPENREDRLGMVNIDAESGVIELINGESFEPMVRKGIIDESFQVAMELMSEKVQESTIYRQALGEPMGSQTAFSTVALLSQIGRTPLTIIQRMTGEAIADAMNKAMCWYKDMGKQCKGLDLKPSQVPDGLQLECNLDVDLPQDKLQQANIMRVLTEGEYPKVSNEWARENILGIGQSEQMDEDIMSEQTFMGMARQYIQQRMMELLQAQQQPPPQVMPPQGMPPEMQGQPMPPEPTGQPVPGGGMEGPGVNPAEGGLPPQMGGMVAPGDMPVPPEEGQGGY